ncbi:MAG: hypothetical protein PHG71_08425 [Kiritimatiellae bacterium]|nr:hypothetical protein [Kiritimatiellia bacterium]
MLWCSQGHDGAEFLEAIGKSRYAIGDDRFRQGAEEEHKERRRSGRRESGHRRLWRKIPRSAPPSES